jgi:hypothetical protein
MTTTVFNLSNFIYHTKVLNQPNYNPNDDIHAVPFLLESDFKLVNNIEQAQVIAMHDNTSNMEFFSSNNIKLRDDQLILLMHIFHHDDHHDPFMFNKVKNPYFNFAKHVLVLHTASKYQEYDIFYDCLWNRQKLYFTEYNKISNLNCRVWTHNCSKKMFDLEEINFNNSIERRKVLAPNRFSLERNFAHRNILRIALTAVLSKTHSFSCYASLNNLDVTDHGGLESESHVNGKTTELGWYPIANKYYNSTYVSMFVETVVTGLSPTITEKTYDPLIKGHYIMPFSYSGIIKDLKEIGFKFPNWIDYSYDTVPDELNPHSCPFTRFAKYIECANKIINMPMDELHTLAIRDIDILHHNRTLFWTLPYHTMHDKILKYMVNNVLIKN